MIKANIKHLLIFLLGIVAFIVIFSSIGFVLYKIQSKSSESIRFSDDLVFKKPSGWLAEVQTDGRIGLKRPLGKIKALALWKIKVEDFGFDVSSIQLDDELVAKEIFRISLQKAGKYKKLYEGYKIHSVEKVILNNGTFVKLTLIKKYNYNEDNDNYWHHIYFLHKSNVLVFSYNFYKRGMAEAEREEKEIYQIIGSLNINNSLR